MAAPRKNYYVWLAMKILSALLGVAIFVMTAFLLWRIYFSGNLPKEMKTLAPNAAICAAYAEHGDSLVLRTQEQPTHTRVEGKNYGYFAVPRFVFIPEARQVQVVFRYNNSTLEATARDYGLAEQPPRGVEIFDVSLVQITDLTPGDRTDDVDGGATLEKTRIAPTSHSVTTTSLYTYFLYVFDNVDMTEDRVAVYFDIYYGGDVNYGADAFGTLRLYHRDAPWLDVKLTSADRRALADFTA